jgi:hypothetical protein
LLWWKSEAKKAIRKGQSTATLKESPDFCAPGLSKAKIASQVCKNRTFFIHAAIFGYLYT